MMVKTDNSRFRMARRLALVVALVAVAVFVFVYGTAAGGTSILEGMLPDGKQASLFYRRTKTAKPTRGFALFSARSRFRESMTNQ